MTTKSSIREKFNLDKIRLFTQAELESISSLKVPILYQLGNNILVGSYKISKKPNGIWAIAGDDQLFFNRKDAIYYCLAVHTKQYEIANEIKINDRLLFKYETDAIEYRYRYKKAKNCWDESVYSCRYVEAVYNIKHIKKQLEKVLLRTKYIKR